MAVIQVSRMQVRRGLHDNLPQLASAELGWSIDERKLFIGNGTLSEGAPSIGNTEILTQYTDLMAVIQSYYFKGTQSGYVSNTSGTSMPIYRAFQDKLDEGPVSVYDFGATGNGVTDDTAAIKRALSEIYPITQSTNLKVRRRLYFPAGTYIISEEIAIPPHATIFGDGIDATVIKQIGAVRSLLTLADSTGSISPNFGVVSGSIGNQFANIMSMTLYNTTDNDVVYLDSPDTIMFDDVKFKGSQTSPTTTGTSTALVRILRNSPSYVPAHMKSYFDGCYFTNGTYGIVGIGDVNSAHISNSIFETLYQGVKLSGTSTIAPRGFVISDSLFDKIANSGIATDAYASVTSLSNYYKSVGNGLSSSPVSPVLLYANPKTYSIVDTFDRTDAQSAIYPRIQSTGSFNSNIASLNTIGSLQTLPGATDVITSSSTFANTSLVLSTITNTNAIIDYNVTRNGNIKTGTMKVSINSLTPNQFLYEDDFVEYPAGAQFAYGINSPTGTELSFIAYGNNLVLSANTSSIGGNVTFKYNVRRFV